MTRPESEAFATDPNQIPTQSLSSAGMSALSILRAGIEAKMM